MPLYVALWLLLLSRIVAAEPLPFPASYQRLVNDTSASLLASYQQNNRDGIVQLINRDPLITRKALVAFLRQPDKVDVARSLAELFSEGSISEMERPLWDFFVLAAPDAKKKLLDAVDLITDAEYAIEHIQRVDRFMDGFWQRALDQLHQGTADFNSIGFHDGEAYSLARWTIYRSSVSNVQDGESRQQALEKARELYGKSSNRRGEAYCLTQLARLNYQALQDRNKAAQLFLLATEKWGAEGSPIRWYFISQYNWLAPKNPVAWLEESKTALQKQPGLRTTVYWMLWNQFDQYRAMLEQEADPVLQIRARWDLFKTLSNQDRQNESVQEADLAIELARRLPYDMSAYGGSFRPAVPSMLLERAYSRIQLGMLREAESDCLEALRLVEQSSSAAESNYLEAVKMPAFDRLGRIYQALGEYPLAIENARQALTLSQKREGGIDWGYKVLAEVHAEMGELSAAEEYLEEALRVPDPYFNPASVWLAELHLNFQRYEEALRDLDRAERGLEEFIKIRPQAQKSSWWGTQRLRLLTDVWLRLGEPERALITAKALEERNHPVEQGMLGIALTALGRDSEAEKYFQARLESLKGAAWPQKEVDALLNLGKICQKQKRYPDADRYLQRALELYRQLGNRRGELAVLLEMAESAHRQHELASSDQSSRQALALANELQDQQGIWSAQHKLAEIALAKGQKPQAIEHLEAAIGAMEEVSGNIKVDFFKMGFLEDKIQVFDELIGLLGPSNPGKAFHYAERRRARAFLESRERAAMLDNNPRDDQRRRRDDLRARLVGKQRALLEQFSKPVADRHPRLIQSLQKDLNQIREAHTQLIKEIELNAPASSASLAEILPLTVQQAQEILPEGQSLLEYVVGDRESYVFHITKQSSRFHRLQIGRRELSKRIKKLLVPFSQLRDGQVDLLHVNYDVGLSHELYRLLFRPAEPGLQIGNEVIVVPDDVLNYLPFESLSRSPTQGSRKSGTTYSEYQSVDWLVKTYNFKYALSATSLSLRREKLQAPATQLVAFGNPSLGGSQRNDVAQAVLRGRSESSADIPQLVPLPQAARESRAIGTLMAGKLQSKVFLGEKATESEFLKEGPSSEYLHFAVHSLVNEERPYYSALVLAPDANSDGLLQTYEILNTRLRSHLVTLSGCETAVGKLKKGEGMLGLQRAFLQAGAESVVVSLWSVEDSTAQLMEAFYKRIRRGDSPAKALQNAKLQYLKSGLALDGGQRLSLSHPFFWAPFVLTTTTTE